MTASVGEAVPGVARVCAAGNLLTLTSCSISDQHSASYLHALCFRELEAHHLMQTTCGLVMACPYQSSFPSFLPSIKVAIRDGCFPLEAGYYIANLASSAPALASSSHILQSHDAIHFVVTQLRSLSEFYPAYPSPPHST